MKQFSKKGAVLQSNDAAQDLHDFRAFTGRPSAQRPSMRGWWYVLLGLDVSSRMLMLEQVLQPLPKHQQPSIDASTMCSLRSFKMQRLLHLLGFGNIV